MKKSILVFWSVFFLNSVFGQQILFPEENVLQDRHDAALIRTDSLFPSFLKLLENLTETEGTLAGKNVSERRSWTGRKIWEESLLTGQKDGFSFCVDPQLGFAYGSNAKGARYTVNTRGFMIRGDFQKKLFFSSAFYETQAVFPEYVNSYIDSFKTVPGSGIPKIFKTNGYDFSSVFGKILWVPSRAISFHLGQGKFFAGDGYRSMLLSDFAGPYLHFAFTWKRDRIKYTGLNAALPFAQNEAEFITGLTDKYATLHLLEVDVTHSTKVVFSDAMIWKVNPENPTGMRVPYFNPVLFTPALLEGSLNSRSNSFVGIALRQRVKKNVVFAQLIIDDFRFSGTGNFHNRVAGQLGVKSYDFCGLQELMVSPEFNFASPYCYAHKDNLSSYSILNQPLAHPLGANFYEALLRVSYSKKRLIVEAVTIMCFKGVDNNAVSWGGNILLSDTQAPSSDPTLSYSTNHTLQGGSQTLYFTKADMGFIVNKKSGLRLQCEVFHRKIHQKELAKGNIWIMFSVKTNLPDKSKDF